MEEKDSTVDLNKLLKMTEDTESDYNPLAEPLISDDVQVKMVKSQSFKDGFEKASYYSGMFTAFVNAGLDVILAHELVNNECIAKSNLEMGKIQLEIAKYNSLNKESQEI